MEIPSPYTAKVAAILVKPGDIVKVGDVLINFSNGEAAEKEPEEQPVKTDDAATPVTAATTKSGPVPASPATRRLARELGIDLHHVTPTGPGGVVTAEDVRTFAEKGQKIEATGEDEAMPIVEAAPFSVPAPSLPDFSKWGPVERVISNLGVFDFDEKSQRMRLKSVHTGVTVQQVVENTSFELLLPEPVPETEPPSVEEILLMREVVDPAGIKRLDFVKGDDFKKVMGEIMKGTTYSMLYPRSSP